MTGRFDGFIQGTDNVLVFERLAMLVDPPIKVLSECFASDGQGVTINTVIFE